MVSFPPNPSSGGGSGTTDHRVLTNRDAEEQHPSESVTVDTTNFNRNLTEADDTVQKALETLDEMSGGFTPQVTHTIYVDNARTDDYTPDGTIEKPYLSVQDAHDSITGTPSITNTYGIACALGKQYTGTLNISKDYISIFGHGMSKGAGFKGTLNITSKHLTLQGIHLTGTSSATRDCYINLSQTGDFLLEIKDCRLSYCTMVIEATGTSGQLSNSYVQVTGANGLWLQNTITCTGIKGTLALVGGLYAVNTLNAYNCYLIMGAAVADSNTINLESGTLAELGGGFPERNTTNLKTGATLYADGLFAGNSLLTGYKNVLNNTGGTLHLLTDGGGIALDTTNFDNNLSSTDTTVQTAMETLNDVIGGFTPQVTKLLFVDKNRTDSYTPDGSIDKPFLTIGAATAIATSGTTIKVIQGTYTEDVTLPSGVCLEGFGANSLTITGNVVVSSGANSSLRYMIINGALTVNANCILIDTYVAGAMTVTGTATIQAWNSHAIPGTSGVTALTMSSSGKFLAALSTIASTGDAPSIAQSAGQVILNTVTVTGGRASSPVINSTGGTFVGLNTQVTNSLGGPAIDVSSSGSTSSNPNMLDGVIATGNVVCGSKSTVVGALVFIVVGALTGSALTYKPASRITNDSSVSGATVKDALETLAANSYTLPTASSTILGGVKIGTGIAITDGVISVSIGSPLIFKGVIDCSASPNYPAATVGDVYKVSVAGKIGSSSGPNVEVGDILLCCVTSAAGTHASVGANWSIEQVNIDGAVIGPASATDNAISRFDSTTGKIIQDSLVTVDDSGSINIPSGQSYKKAGTALAAVDVGAEPTIATKNTAFNKNYGATATDVKINGTQSVGSIDAIARIDHIHPVDTSRAAVSHSHTESDVTNLVTDLAGKQPIDTLLTAIAALTGTSGLIRVTGDGTCALDTNTYLTAITKTLVEAVLTGTITSHDHSGVYQLLDADLTAIAALTGSIGLLKKTAEGTWVIDTSSYLTANQSIAVSGDATGSGTTAIALTLANSGATAGTYKSVTVDAKGRVTAGSNPTTLTGFGITDAALADDVKTWTEVTGTTQAMAVNRRYIANNAAQVVFTLPATAVVGDIIEVAGKGAGGWRISQNASQQIVFGSVITATGTGGYMYSNSQYEAVKLLCLTANTLFTVLRATGSPELI